MDIQSEIRKKEKFIDRLMTLAEHIEEKGKMSKDGVELFHELKVEFRLDKPGEEEVDKIFECVDKLERDIGRYQAAMSM